MTHNINAEIISIGTEILLGELTDTNSVFIARSFRDIGVNVFYMTSVGDNKERIANAIRIALSRAQVVITCGGLGPTVDDMTRQAVAIATDRELVFHQALLDQIAARFAGYKVAMTENNRQQAYLPADATVIENPVGTAPSFIVEHNGAAVISLPGVPREMKFLMTERVVPYLHQKYSLGIIKARILKAAGIGESSLDEMIGRAILEGANPTVGLAAHHGEIDIRITAKADTMELADAMIAETEVKIREVAGRFIYGVDEDVLEQVLTDFLKGQKMKIGVVQAGMGDFITSALKRAPGSDVVLAISESYPTPEAARIAHEIDPALTMREAAKQIAEAIFNSADVVATLVVMGLPDVDEGDDKSESTVVVVYTPNETGERVYGFGGKSQIASEWIPRWMLSRVWRILKDQVEANAN